MIAKYLQATSQGERFSQTDENLKRHLTLTPNNVFGLNSGRITSILKGTQRVMFEDFPDRLCGEDVV